MKRQWIVGSINSLTRKEFTWKKKERKKNSLNKRINLFEDVKS